MIRPLLVAAGLALVAACAPRAGESAAPEAKAGGAAPAPIAPRPTDLPAGTYRLDPTHASLVFKVDHLGFSAYTGQFRIFDATLELDPADPAAARLEARVDARSLVIPAPPEGFLAELLGPAWLNAGAFPDIIFRSSAVTLTAPDAARIDGALSFNGVTAPVSFEARFNGGYKGFPPYDPAARIGFSAKGALMRSVFNVAAGLAPPGSTLGVGDRVDFEIEAEFHGPPAAE